MSQYMSHFTNLTQYYVQNLILQHGYTSSCVNEYAYWDKMSRFSSKCVHCRVVALSCCWEMTSHLWLTFVSPSSISMRYYQRIVIDEEFSNLKMELYFWNMLTKYHYGLIVCIQCYCCSFYINYHISARHKWDIRFRWLNTDGKMCWKTRKQ